LIGIENVDGHHSISQQEIVTRSALRAYRSSGTGSMSPSVYPPDWPIDNSFIDEALRTPAVKHSPDLKWLTSITQTE
jgi:hypothetical protein